MKQLAASNHLIIHIDKGVTTADGPSIMAMLMDDGSIYAYLGDHWHRTGNEPANATAVAVSSVGYWCLGQDGRIYKWNEKPAKSSWVKDKVAKDVTTLSCDAMGNLWCTNKKGQVFVSKAEFAGLGGEKTFIPGPWTEVPMAGGWFMGQGKTWTYTVKQGDGLMQIVRDKYGITEGEALKAKVAEIATMNGLASPDSIKAGQSLTMPPRS